MSAWPWCSSITHSGVGGSNKKGLTTMFEDLAKPSKRLLEPMERISEILFALIMVLTFTCSFSVADAGRSEVRTMLIGAVGCNLAWAIIDAVFYLMGNFSAFGQGLLRLKALRQEPDHTRGHQIIAQALPPVLVAVLSASDLDLMRQRLIKLDRLPPRPRLSKKDWMGAAGVFLIILLATLPVVLPFALIEEAPRALRVSNGIAVLMLFLTGYAFGRYAGHRPWGTGALMVIIGSGMVAITISLGG